MEIKNKSLYQNCRELPIHNFNEIIITGDFKFLVKDGSEQDTEELANHWQNIIDEFHEISNDKTFNMLLKNKAELMYLQGKCMACEIIISLFGMNLNDYQKELIQKLRKSYRIKDAKLSLAHTTNRLNIKISQFERMSSHKESKTSLGAMIINISRIVGYKLDRFTTTVEEWVEAVKMADEIIKANQKNKQKN